MNENAVMSIIQKAQAAVPEMKPVVDMTKFESGLEPFRERTKKGLEQLREAVESL